MSFPFHFPCTFHCSESENRSKNSAGFAFELITENDHFEMFSNSQKHFQQLFLITTSITLPMLTTKRIWNRFNRNPVFFVLIWGSVISPSYLSHALPSEMGANSKNRTRSGHEQTLQPFQTMSIHLHQQ